MNVNRAKVTIENLGPFEQAEIEIKPLTIFIGRNSTGKSFLVQFLWALTVIRLDKIHYLLKKPEIKSELERLEREIVERIKSGLDVSEEFKKLAKLCIEILPELIALSLQETIEMLFQSSPSELIREGAERAAVLVETPRAVVRVVFERDNIRVFSERLYRDFADKLRVESLGSGRMRVSYVGDRSFSLDFLVQDEKLNVSVLMRYLIQWYVFETFEFFFTTPMVISMSTFPVTALFADARASVLRLMLRPDVPRVLIDILAREIPLQEGVLLDLYSSLIDYLVKGLIDLDLVRLLLSELGCLPEIVREQGTYVTYVKTWSGKRLPLYKAPSSICEVLLVVLALASRSEPYLIVIDYPETYLHPRAQCTLARIIAKTINRLGKTVILTTHSDAFLYALENLIMASEIREEAKKLGIDESEILDPDKVAVYLIKPDGTKAVSERLEVTSGGILEEEFTKVVEKLSEERAQILALSKRKRRTSSSE